MSLINEALRKARQEAAEQDAEERSGNGRRSAAPAAQRAHLPNETKLGQGVVVGLVIGLLIALLALGAWWFLSRNATEPPTIANATDLVEDGVPARDSATPPAPAVVAPTTITVAPTSPQAADAPPAAATEPPPPAFLGTASVPPASTSAETSSVAAPSTRARTASIPPPPTSAETGPPPTSAAEPLPTLIEPPDQVGRVGDSDTFVLQADVGDQSFELDFIVWSSKPFAQINGRQVTVGQQIEGYLVTAIDRDQVTLRNSQREIVVRVR